MAVQQSDATLHATPTALQPPPKQVVQSVQQLSSPMQNSSALTVPETSNFFVGLVVPMPTDPEVDAMFNPPDLVCAVDPVLIGAATLPPGGFSVGEVQATARYAVASDNASTPKHSAIPFCENIFISFLLFSFLLFYFSTNYFFQCKFF
jgi:hypothetical protein